MSSKSRVSRLISVDCCFFELWLLPLLSDSLDFSFVSKMVPAKRQAAVSDITDGCHSYSIFAESNSILHFRVLPFAPFLRSFPLSTHNARMTPCLLYPSLSWLSSWLFLSLSSLFAFFPSLAVTYSPERGEE